MTSNPPEPVDNPNSYATGGYDDRQADGMDADDGRAIAERSPASDPVAGPSDAERVEEDPPAQ